MVKGSQLVLRGLSEGLAVFAQTPRWTREKHDEGNGTSRGGRPTLPSSLLAPACWLGTRGWFLDEPGEQVCLKPRPQMPSLPFSLNAYSLWPEFLSHHPLSCSVDSSFSLTCLNLFFPSPKDALGWTPSTILQG